jgi:hypothetical protein
LHYRSRLRHRREADRSGRDDDHAAGQDRVAQLAWLTAAQHGPCPSGTFVRRVAHTPHYDGVKAGGAEPAVIAICGIGPNNQQ